MHRRQKSGCNHGMRLVNKLSEYVCEFEYLGSIVTSQNYIEEEPLKNSKFGDFLLPRKFTVYYFHVSYSYLKSEMLKYA
jgi:hypothetical protein